jgi:hypothetical protein
VQNDPRSRSALAGILESGGGVRVVVTEPWRFKFHLQRGERLFIVPGVWLSEPIPYEAWPWTIGAAEIHVATTIWPERLERWGTWEAEKYFRERILPLITGKANRPPDWWMRPADWTLT